MKRKKESENKIESIICNSDIDGDRTFFKKY